MAGGAAPSGRKTAAAVAALGLVLGGFVGFALLVGGASDTAGSQSASAELLDGDQGTGHGAPDEHGAAVIGPANGTPTRHVGPQGRVGQFVAKCTWSHSAPDDPIVHFGHPGRSHLHDFYGATATDSYSTAEELLEGDTTCDKEADLAAYWQPALIDGDTPAEPVQIAAYYRAAPGVDPGAVEPFPFGLEMVTGDPFATSPTESEAAGWVCGSSTRLAAEPPECPGDAPLHMMLTFPDCWDGERVRSEDHQAHVAHSRDGECPSAHPVHMPQLTVSIKYPVSGPDHDLRLASGNVYSAHGDFLNAWEPEGLRREVEGCIHRDVVCDLASNREEEPLFSAN